MKKSKISYEDRMALHEECSRRSREQHAAQLAEKAERERLRVDGILEARRRAAAVHAKAATPDT